MRKEKKLVSIIIPTFNRGYLIRRALKSCLNQSYANIEVVVVDDCSSDNTEEIVNSLKDKRIRYFRNSKNMGGCFSRNKGIELSRGDYINFLDDDDELREDKIELQLKKFEESKVKNLGVVVCDVEYFRTDLKCVKRNRARGYVYSSLLKSYYVYGIHSMLIRREVFEKVSYDDKLDSNQEYDLTIQIGRYFNFDYVPRVLALVYESSNQISFNFKKKISGTRYFYCKYESEFKKNNVYFYNFCRFKYLLLKYYIGLVFGKNVYKCLK